jgi:hypothetical protein
MKRRSFLKAVAVAAPTAGLRDFLVVLAPRRVPHTFSSVGTTPARMIIAFCPAGKMEQYFRDAEIARQHAGDADFMARYELEWVGPSPFWKA